MNSTISKRDFLKMMAMGTACCGVAPVLNPLSAKNPSGLGFIDMIARMDESIWKWSKVACYYVKTPKGLKCQKCPNECYINEEKDSICRTKVPKGDKLYTIAYGNPCALNIDPVEKKPLYHFYPTSRTFSIATAGCVLACLNCQNWSISQSSPRQTTNYDLMPEKVVGQALEYRCKSIAYTYSEPVAFYEYTLDTSKLARQKGIKNILVTSGYINEKPLREWCQYVDAANVDLKSFSEEMYLKLNAGELKTILNSLKVMKEEGVWLEITNLIVPNWTDDLDMIRKMCDWLYDNGFEDTPLHFSRFSPRYKLKHLPATPVKTLEKARFIAKKAGIRFVYIGNVPGHDAGHTWCPNPECRKLLMERKGYRLGMNNIKDGKCRFCGTKIPGLFN